MHGPDDAQILTSPLQLADRSADVGERLTEILAAMTGDEHEALDGSRWNFETVRQPCAQAAIESPQRFRASPMQRVDDSVAGDLHRRTVDPFLSQVDARTVGRTEVPSRQPGNDGSVHLFRERVFVIVSA